MSGLDKWFVFGKDAGFDAGLQAYEAGAFADATHLFESFLATGPTEPALVRIAKLCLAESLKRMGEQLQEEGSHAEAVPLYQRAVNLQPSFPDLRYLIAHALGAIGQRQEALRHLGLALLINRQFVGAHLLKAIYLYESDRAEDAMDSLLDAIQADPNLEDQKYERFVVMHNQGNADEALEALWDMTRNGQELVKPLLMQANAAFSAGEFEAAAEQFTRLVEAVPGYADVRCRYGQALLELNEIEAAEAQLRAALQLNPDYADAHAALGVALRRLGNEPQAKAHFSKALDLMPDHVVATAEIARLR